MITTEKIRLHIDNKNYVKITRIVAKNTEVTNRGYILDLSADFLLMQETDDFKLLGYFIFPLIQVKEIRFATTDKYYNKIMIWEGEADKVGIGYKIDLKNWLSIFKSIKKMTLNVIVECEAPKIDTFTIGPIMGASAKKVSIQYFDAAGFIDEDLIKIDYTDITKVTFDDRYINTFSKYLRKRKGAK